MYISSTITRAENEPTNERSSVTISGSLVPILSNNTLMPNRTPALLKDLGTNQVPYRAKQSHRCSPPFADEANGTTRLGSNPSASLDTRAIKGGWNTTGVVVAREKQDNKQKKETPQGTDNFYQPRHKK